MPSRRIAVRVTLGCLPHSLIASVCIMEAQCSCCPFSVVCTRTQRARRVTSWNVCHAPPLYLSTPFFTKYLSLTCHHHPLNLTCDFFPDCCASIYICTIRTMQHDVSSASNDVAVVLLLSMYIWTSRWLQVNNKQWQDVWVCAICS